MPRNKRHFSIKNGRFRWGAKATRVQGGNAPKGMCVEQTWLGGESSTQFKNWAIFQKFQWKIGQKSAAFQQAIDSTHIKNFHADESVGPLFHLDI